MQILGDYPGLPGLFVAGVFSAALSSLSTGLNSMSAVVLEDFFKTFSKVPLTQRQTHYIMRGVVAVFGAICVGLVLVVQNLGSVLQLSMSLGSVTNGPLLGIFSMAVLLPWVTGTGAIIGGVSGLCIMAWICTKAQTAMASGELSFVVKPTNTQGCSYTYIGSAPMNMLAVNVTEAPSTIATLIDDSDFAIYHISYMWYTLLGATITIVVAVIASFALGANDPRTMNPKLLTPFVRRLIWGKSAGESVRAQPIGTESERKHSDDIDLQVIGEKLERVTEPRTI